MSFARYVAWKTFSRFPALRTSLTRLLVSDDDVDVELFGSRLRVNKRAEIGLWRAARAAENNIIFRDEVASLLNLALLLQPGDVFVDVGANVGLYSATLGRVSQLLPDNRVVAIEANPDTANRLRETLRDAHAEIINVALSERDAELEFVTGVTSGVFSASAGDDNGTTVRVPCRTFDSLALPAGDLVVKIDVEGHELQVLRGAEQTLSAGRVKVLYVDGYSSSDVPQLLRDRGFRFYDGRTLQPFGDTAPPYSLLAIHSSR